VTRLALIRHGPTAWNEVGRVQGQSDVPLSARGRALVGAWRLPATLAGFGRGYATFSRCWRRPGGRRSR